MTRQELLEFRTARGVHTRGTQTRFQREITKREVRVIVTNVDILKRRERRL